ncbi:O-antigen ligase family protein [Lysinibacillus sp. LZ02]|uniref:O-antigen ligase family protein n=1 Tax=Lysinibacillus sp. LZ02 TaxID=3420668 RepID=UPI003D35E5C9
MQRMKQSLLSKEVLTIVLLVAVTFLSLLLPSKIALIVTSLIFAIFAFIKPLQSVLYLLIYVAIRPLLVELNPGLKFIGDLITFILLIKLLIASRFDIKGLLNFKLFEWAFFFFLGVGSLVGYLNGVSIGAIVFQVRTFVIMYLVYYFLSRTVLPANWKEQLSWTAVGLGWLVSLHGLVEKISIRQWLLPEYWQYMPLSAENLQRIYGLPGNPNSLALIMMFTIIAVLFLKNLYKNMQYKWFLNISLVLFIGVLILTFSRGTLIAGAFFAITYLIFSRDWKLVKTLAIGWIAAFILVYYPVNASVSFVKYLGVEAPDGTVGSLADRFGQILDNKNVDRMVSNGRVFYIKKGFEIYQDYPVAGTGFGTFGGAATISYGSPIYADYGIDLSIYFENKIYSDNQYIQIIAETGTLGVILFAVYLLAMVALFWKQRHTRFGQMMIGLWIATGVCGAFYNIWELKVYTLIFFTIFAAFAVDHKFYKQYRV